MWGSNLEEPKPGPKGGGALGAKGPAESIGPRPMLIGPLEREKEATV